MLGLGRALGETIAVLIILRGTQTRVRLVALQRRRDLRVQDRRHRSGVRRPVQDRRLHRRRPGAVRPDLRGQRAGPRRGRRKDRQHHDLATLDQPRRGAHVPGRQRAPQGHQQPRRPCWSPPRWSIALVPLVWMLYTVVSKGIGVVRRARWWTNSQRASPRSGGRRRVPRDPGHAAAGPGLRDDLDADRRVVGIYLVEYGGGTGWASRPRFMVDILTGVPSIVAALFIYALWVATLGFQRSGFAVSLALVLLMIPVIVRSTEEMLRLVPKDLREACYALGVPKWKTIVGDRPADRLLGHRHRHPAGLARVMGETAPLLILVATPGDELRHVRRLHGHAARHDVRPDVGRSAPTRSDRPVVGAALTLDPADRRAQHRRPVHRQVLRPQEGLGRSPTWPSASTSRTSTSTTAPSTPSRASRCRSSRAA